MPPETPIYEALSSESFLEYAFLRWVLTPAAKSEIVKRLEPQKQIESAGHRYKVDYAIEGEQNRIAVELDGFEFLQELRKQPAFVDIPVIVVTAKDLTAEDYRILSGQTERIIAKDQAYLNELTVAVRARLAQQPTRETERLAY